MIFDEFHLRNLDADLALALTLNGRELFRDDAPLKVLLMSATLEGERLSRLLDYAPIVSSEGRMYPVSTIWSSRSSPVSTSNPGPSVRALMLSTSRQAACLYSCQGRLRSVVFKQGWKTL